MHNRDHILSLFRPFWLPKALPRFPPVSAGLKKIFRPFFVSRRPRPRKARAFRRAAQSLENWPDLFAPKNLCQIWHAFLAGFWRRFGPPNHPEIKTIGYFFLGTFFGRSFLDFVSDF